MGEETRRTKAIHDFVRGHLSWDESINLLEEILDSEEWLQFLETDMRLQEMALMVQKY
jgi:hypothetical protein